MRSACCWPTTPHQPRVIELMLGRADVRLERGRTGPRRWPPGARPGSNVILMTCACRDGRDRGDPHHPRRRNARALPRSPIIVAVGEHGAHGRAAPPRPAPDGHLGKPVKAEELMRRHLGRARGRGRAAALTPPPATDYLRAVWDEGRPALSPPRRPGAAHGPRPTARRGPASWCWRTHGPCRGSAFGARRSAVGRVCFQHPPHDRYRRSSPTPPTADPAAPTPIPCGPCPFLSTRTPGRRAVGRGSWGSGSSGGRKAGRPSSNRGGR